MKHLGLLVVTVVVFGFFLALVPLPTVKAETTTSFTSTTSDGEIMNTDLDYITSHDASSGYQVTDSETFFDVGQSYSAGYYPIYRSVVFFDTSSIPDTANITSVILSVYISDDTSTEDFNVTILKGTFGRPHNPLELGDYKLNWYNPGDNYGSRNTSEIGGVGYWNITATKLGGASGILINDAGLTDITLVSSKDVAAESPSYTPEFIEIYARENGEAYAPKLYVTYTIPAVSYYNYNFYGPFDEETGLALNENVTVGIYSTEGIAFAQFSFNGSYSYSISTFIQFFQFTFSDNSTREYWIDPSENSYTDIYIFKADSTSYVINFLDTAGYLQTYPYVTAKRYINGTLYTVEKRKVDSYGSIMMNLIAGRTYQLSLGNAANTYVFGDLTMTGITAVQLVLRAVDFPQQTLLTQKYVRVYAYRNASTITIIFADTQSNTESVDIAIYLTDFTSVYNTTQTAQSFTVTWTNASSTVTYQVTVTIHHLTYGDLTFKQILAKTLAGSPPFSLAFLGQWAFDSTFLIPAIIILFTAGCFSALNAEVGAILACIAAIALTWMGWIPIPAGSLVVASTLAILLALVVHKRGG